MDPLQSRLDALEQQMHTVTRRLCWWRGLACGLAVAGLLGWAYPSAWPARTPAPAYRRRYSPPLNTGRARPELEPASTADQLRHVP